MRVNIVNRNYCYPNLRALVESRPLGVPSRRRSVCLSSFCRGLIAVVLSVFAVVALPEAPTANEKSATPAERSQIGATARVVAGGRSTVPEVSIAFALPEAKPYILGEGTAIDWNKPGVTLEVLQLTAQKLGVKFVYRRIPWNRALYLVESGEIDGVLSSSFSESRSRFGAYPMTPAGSPDASRALYSWNWCFYKRRDSPFAWNGQQAINLRGNIGACIGYALVDDLKNRNLPVETAESEWINLKKLQEGRLGAFGGIEDNTDYVIKEHHSSLPDIVKLQPCFATKDYFLMFSKAFVAKKGDLAEKIWDTYRDTRQSSAYAEILKKYRATDSSGPSMKPIR